jgi:hypothetical protein
MAPPTTAATAAIATAIWTEIARPAAGTAVEATTRALFPTVVAATLADCMATNSVISFLLGSIEDNKNNR